MKKYGSIFLALLLAVSAAACAKGTNAVSSSGNSGSSLSSQEILSVPEPVSSAPASSAISSAAPSSAPDRSSASSSAEQPAEDGDEVPQGRETVRVVIPEGFTFIQIANRLEANGVCKKADLLKTAATYDFSYYPLVKNAKNVSHRIYRLEGYLFPDTYQFYKDMKPQDALGKMLRRSRDVIGGKYSYSGMTNDQVIILASIIQKEAASAADMQKISSVFHNRLAKKMPLQADATVFYLTNKLIPDSLVEKYKFYYNTVSRIKGLPAGPICSPGTAALNAAAHPAKAGYLYFAGDQNGKYYYADTYEEHLKNLEHAGIVEGGSMK